MSQRKNRFGYASEQVSQPEQPLEPEVLLLPAQSKPLPGRESTASGMELVQGSATDALLNPAAYALPAQRRGKRTEAGVLKRTDMPREQLNVRIRPELKRAAAGLAGLTGMTLGDVVEAALIEYLNSRKNDR